MSSSRSDQRIFGVLMTRNEADILPANIRHHLSIGCERILVVENGSTDKTPAVLAKLAQHLPVEWSTDAGELRQPEIVTELAQRAREQGAGWVVPLDTDEFWRPTRPLAELCAEADGFGALEAPRIEFVSPRDQIHSTRRGPLRATMRVEPVLLGNEPIAEFMAKRRSMYELAPPPKLLMRTTAELKVDRGAHAAAGLAGPHKVDPDLAIFHLAMRSRDEAFKRVEHGKRVGAVEEQPSVSFQNRYWLEMADEDRLEEAWRAHSYADGALDVAGRRVPLVDDDRLARMLEPWLLSRAELLARKLARRLRSRASQSTAVR